MERVSTPRNVYEQDENIILRTAEPTDGKLISDYFIANKNFLKPWEPSREEAFYSEAGWTKRLIKLHELHRMGLGYYLIILDSESGEMMGTVSFSNVSRFPFHACNLGYSLAENAQGKGVMTRAMRLAIKYMFSIQNVHRIMAAYLPRNHKSEATLMRLGFKKEGMAKDYLLIDGVWEDHILSSLVNDNWTAT